MSEPTHQLVVQFPVSAFWDSDAMVRFEDSLSEVLGDRHSVDGHDVGSGEVNFFVLTDDPRAALAAVQKVGDPFDHPGTRVAARLVEGEDYELLWPAGDTHPFAIR
jgi:hypothetical protein